MKYRCSMLPMPNDVKNNPISQLPYISQSFDLFKIEAEEAGFTIERHGDSGSIRDNIITLQVRPEKTLIVFTKNNIVKSIM